MEGGWVESESKAYKELFEDNFLCLNFDISQKGQGEANEEISSALF